MVYDRGRRIQTYTVRGEEEVGGGKEIWTEPEMWSQVQHFPSASEPWFIMKKFQGELTQSKPEVTERSAQANNLCSCLCFPPFCSLSIFICGSVTSTLLCLLGPSGVRAVHVCCQAGNVSVSERQLRCNVSNGRA